MSVTFLKPNATNDTSVASDGWFSDILDEAPFVLVTLDDGDSDAWRGSFVPPPPRPLFLDDGVSPDGLTTCDMCTWAWQNGQSFGPKVALEGGGNLGWVLTLTIVSLISAVLGAIVMIVVIHCKSRMKNGNTNESPPVDPQTRPTPRPPLPTPDDKSSDNQFPHLSPTQVSGVWSWLSRRSAGTPSAQLESYPISQVENHYTHMEGNYNDAGESLYAELDKEEDEEAAATVGSGRCEDENAGYTDAEAPTSSAPSSAYYSDLSVNGVVVVVSERAYEVVSLDNLGGWEGGKGEGRRLGKICESVGVPSDYV